MREQQSENTNDDTSSEDEDEEAKRVPWDAPPSSEPSTGAKEFFENLFRKI
jgi:hypothetical protein